MRLLAILDREDDDCRIDLESEIYKDIKGCFNMRMAYVDSNLYLKSVSCLAQSVLLKVCFSYTRDNVSEAIGRLSTMCEGLPFMPDALAELSVIDNILLMTRGDYNYQ